MFKWSLRVWALIALLASWVYLDFIRTPVTAEARTTDDGYAITELESFGETVRILSTETYRRGRESDLSPIDLAVGWGVMADPSVYNRINISQGNRWYYWRANQMPIPRRDIERHSTNIHVVPANAQIAAKLKRLHRGDLIRISGSLIEVNAPDGWRWRSSLTRDDTGQGACEVLLLREVEWVRTPASIKS